ncbi:hypothetical protein MKW94_020865 [Papaver nudicaule]|uniref:DNA/RNA-binding protein Alba-like domain-containing protein n=1 Tax=Papaver nudicaule TaxID=74823 RepID=A0AA42AU70_PAPNU|nr:hypothetical protein [Papaver nudicaule]
MEAVVVSSSPPVAKNERAITSNGGGGGSHYKKNRIQVSNTKKPLFFYVNLAKRYMRQHSEVELSALGMAIATVVTISEILKNHGLAIEKKLVTSTVDMKDENKGRLVQKAKIEILLGKTENFDNLVAKAAAAVAVAAPATASTDVASAVNVGVDDKKENEGVQPNSSTA